MDELPPQPPRGRIAFAIVAAIAGAGELIFLVANTLELGSPLRALVWTSAYLTDWTGALVAIVCAAAALGWRFPASPAWLGLATVAVVLVGTMFAWLGGFADLRDQAGMTLYYVSNLLAHALAPWTMLLAWLFFADHGRLRWRDPAWFMLFPFVYLVQMFGRGALGRGYPYPQVDVARVGWRAALQFAGGATLLFLVMGLMLVMVDRLLAKREEVLPMSRIVPAGEGDGGAPRE